MRIYKELRFIGNKIALDNFKENASSFIKQDWKYIKSDRLSDHIIFDYVGNKADKARVYIYYGENYWRNGEIRVVNIIPLVKNELTIEEYNVVLDLFYNDIIKPNQEKFSDITVVGPESDFFDPLMYISKNALIKLEKFCNAANKSTGSSHPCDEERWFDFICQTVEDNQIFDYDTLYRFLIDEDYWGKKKPDSIEVMGSFAWDKDEAEKLAMEYDNYVRFLQYYKSGKWQIKHEDIHNDI